LFEFKYAVWEKKIDDFCYAGRWSFCIDLCTGMTKKCYASDTLPNVFDNPTAPVIEAPVCHQCREPHCYNGHAFLTFGLVPSIQTPTYADMRDRVCQNGSHWLTPKLRAFFSQKLHDNNPEYTQKEKDRLNQVTHIPSLKLFRYRIQSLFSKRIQNKLKILQKGKGH
jgi:hypothetical protein